MTNVKFIRQLIQKNSNIQYLSSNGSETEFTFNSLWKLNENFNENFWAVKPVAYNSWS